jgi:nitrogen regulation protein NR(I)
VSAKHTNAYSVLIIDDEDALRYSIKRALSQRAFTIYEADSGEAGIEVAKKQKMDIILLDNRMKGMNGIEALQHLRGICPDAKIIVMTAFSTTQTTIEAMKFGAFDYVMKPFDLPKILSLVDSAVDVISETNKNKEQSSIEDINLEEDIKAGIIGNSLSMQTVYKRIGQVSSSDVTVLITGESGTGKELIARAVHKNSLRNNKPFIAVNCSAIPENLIESELFGHEKGAFTGANQQRIGYFEQCDSGTIFLDEIGDMPLAAQTKILRALQEGELLRVGGSDVIKVDVRIIAATNKSIESMVKEGTFREDLYYRLNVVRIELPPLRERKEDIPLLINFLLKKVSKNNQGVAEVVASDAMAALTEYEWPGNVRELENVMHRSAVLSQGDSILLKDLPSEITTLGPSELSESNLFEKVYTNLDPSAGGLLKRVEVELIRVALKHSNDDLSKAAKVLGITNAALKKKLSALESEK